MSTQDIGQRGEDIAVNFLISQGYRIRDRNLRLGRDEIDIIAFDPVDKVIAFVEVKTLRRRDADYHPSPNYNWKKKCNTLRAARKWVIEERWGGGYRVDLLCVVGQRVVEHVKEVNFGY